MYTPDIITDWEKMVSEYYDAVAVGGAGWLAGTRVPLAQEAQHQRVQVHGVEDVEEERLVDV